MSYFSSEFSPSALRQAVHVKNHIIMCKHPSACSVHTTTLESVLEDTCVRALLAAYAVEDGDAYAPLESSCIRGRH